MRVLNPANLFNLEPRDVFVGVMLIVVSRLNQYVPETYIEDVTYAVGAIFYLAYNGWLHYMTKSAAKPEPKEVKDDVSFEDWLDGSKR